jgi:hypothetical protein
MRQVTTTTLSFDNIEILDLLRQVYDIPEDADIRIDDDGVAVTYTKDLSEDEPEVIADHAALDEIVAGRRA